MREIDKFTQIISSFLVLVSRKLPDDVVNKLELLYTQETNPTAKKIYNLMFQNMLHAENLQRPLCQDTGVLQFFIRCGTEFPWISELENILRNGVLQATKIAPLRHNCVETFDEYNTGNNVGKHVPYIHWNIEPGKKCSIYAYMAGGGCTLPGKATVLMPSQGYEGVVQFVLDTIIRYGINACPPLLVGVGIATSAETAAMLSKEALLRPVESYNDNPRAAKLEHLLENALDSIGIGPQGLSGCASVMGVNVGNSARHPSTIGVGVSVGCWAHRRGCLVLDHMLHYEIPSHKGVQL